MAPTAIETQFKSTNGVHDVAALKAQNKSQNQSGTTPQAQADQPYNPFYSPPAPEDSEKDKDYKYSQYKVRFHLPIGCANLTDSV